MKVKRHLQSLPSTPEQPQRDADIPRAAFQVGDVLPTRLDRDAMCRIFNVGHSQFHRLCRQGRFDRFVLKPTVGRTAWSGRLVQAHLDGELVPVARAVRKRA